MKTLNYIARETSKHKKGLLKNSILSKVTYWPVMGFYVVVYWPPIQVPDVDQVLLPLVVGRLTCQEGRGVDFNTGV